ncbi:bifunctional DNA primase/polymerase [Mycobacterium neglectum]|uniref:bifunctional DNA primase/polymerase n=1 Tax=Mycobacterium neglectum TaxID=242737 RepID=UPI001145388F|nr:bifunctional DNA primase/polymerase [Mycobacterium neglectum]
MPQNEKSPPPTGFTGGGKPYPSDEQVADWLANGHKSGNIALRLAEVPREYRPPNLPVVYAGNNVDGWELVGIDIDNYAKGDGPPKRGADELHDLECDLGELPDTALSGARLDTGSCIAVYLVPKGYGFIGKAASAIEIIQERHRYMATYPSTNPDAPVMNGQPAIYEWCWGAPSKLAEAGQDAMERFDGGLPAIDRVTVLPEAWFTHLTCGGLLRSDDPVSDLPPDELVEWIKARPLFDAEPCQMMKSSVARRIAEIEASPTSHDRLTDTHWELLNLAAEGHAGLSWALAQVEQTWWERAKDKRAPEEASGEMGRSVLGALSKIQPRYVNEDGQPLGVPDDRCAVDTNKCDVDGWAERLEDRAAEAELAADVELEAFWSARPELERLRTFARARLVGPWSVLGAVLARAIATIPPHVVLPPTVGSEASLNLFVALVAPSGFGKGASEAVAEDFLITELYPFVATPGSGEGLLKQYAYKKKTEQINVRDTAIFTVPEIDTFAALTARGGSTLMPELRKAWMGERLGFGWSDVEKAVVMMSHRYRMTMIVGVQPGRGGALLQDADGGTPQRFIWLPTTDPDAPDDPPAEPEPLRLPAWPMPSKSQPDDPTAVDAESQHEDDAGDSEGSTRLNFAVVQYKLQEPADKTAFHVLGLPPSVVDAIRREHLAKRRGEVSEAGALDSHAMLARLKIAAGLMWLNGRTDKVTEEDWDLAGTILAVSRTTRASVLEAMKSNATKTAQAMGRRDAEREVVKDDVMRDKKIARVVERIREKLRANNGQAKAKLKRQFGPDKEIFDEALARLVDVGDVELKPIEYNGRPGHTVWLRAGR